MKKFILFKDHAEVKNYYEGCTLDKVDNYPEVIKTFDNKDEALEELKKYNTQVTDYRNYLLVEEYYVEEQEQDEDGEFVEGGDIWEYSKLEECE